MTVTMVCELVAVVVLLVAQLTRAFPQTGHELPPTERGTVAEVCNTEEFEARCPSGHVILVTWAKYGRMRIGRCAEDDLGGAIGCSRDVMVQADRLCSGKASCVIRIPNRDFEVTRPCPKELKSYLELGYKCVRVCSSATPQSPVTSEANMTSSAAAVTGYFANIAMSEIGCEPVSKPWVMTAIKGQTINLTIYDVSGRSTDSAMTSSPQPSPCIEYGYVDDSARLGSNAVEPLCSGTSARVLSNVYASRGNVIKFWPSAIPGRTFILEYLVIGCADFEAPNYVTFERTDSGGVLRCKDTDAQVTLTCQGHTWVTSVLNCTQDVVSIVTVTEDSRTGIPVSLGAASSIIILAAILVCLTILAMGFMRYRTSHKRKHTDNMALHVTLMSSSAACTRTHRQSEGQSQGQGHVHHHHPHQQLQHGGDAQPAVAVATGPSPATAARDAANYGKTMANVVRINGSDYEHIWEATQQRHQQQGAAAASVSSSPSKSPCKRPAALYTSYKQQSSDSAATMLAPGRTGLAQYQAENMAAGAGGASGLPVSQNQGRGAYPTERKVAREKPIYITARDICTLPPPSVAAAAPPSAASGGLDLRRHGDSAHGQQTSCMDPYSQGW